MNPTITTFLTAHPSDVLDAGVDFVLDRVCGELGATGLAVWAALPATNRLCVRQDAACFDSSPGGLLFAPQVRHYQASRLKPIVAQDAKGRDPLARIAAACDERSTPLRVCVSATRTGLLAARHSEMAAKSFLDVASQKSLCPANPDVGAYLVGLARDLSESHHLAGVHFADFTIHWSEAFDPTLETGVEVADVVRTLLSVCFCESCRQAAGAAGVEFEPALALVKAVVEKGLAGSLGSDVCLKSILADGEPLAKYLNVQADVLSTLLARIRDACSCDLILDRRFNPPIADAVPNVDMSIPAAVATSVDALHDAATVACFAARRNEIRFTTRALATAPASQVVTTMGDVARAGFAAIVLDDYGLLPETTFDAIRQGIRFARRSAG